MALLCVKMYIFVHDLREAARLDT